MHKWETLGRYAVSDKNWFEEPPNDTPEVGRWRAFRAAYHKAENLERGEFPLQIDFELNSTCQMKCAFCTHGQEKVAKRFLDYEAFCKVIDEGAEYGLCSIKLNYINEPLLNKDLEQFVRYAKQKGVLNVYFATNGLLLNEKRARSLIDAGVSKLLISLDAATPETFLKIRRSPHLGKIKENIRRLLKLRGDGWPKVRVNFLQTPLNAHESNAFIEQWQGVADMIGLQHRLGVPGHDSGEMDIGEDFQCSTPFKLCVVDSGGSILPCCAFGGREMPIGHIDTHTIHEAWNSERMESLRKLHRRAGYRDNPICKHCVSSC